METLDRPSTVLIDETEEVGPGRIELMPGSGTRKRRRPGRLKGAFSRRILSAQRHACPMGMELVGIANKDESGPVERLCSAGEPARFAHAFELSLPECVDLTMPRSKPAKEAPHQSSRCLIVDLE